jgi:hypothetical protein
VEKPRRAAALRSAPLSAAVRKRDTVQNDFTRYLERAVPDIEALHRDCTGDTVELIVTQEDRIPRQHARLGADRENSALRDEERIPIAWKSKSHYAPTVNQRGTLYSSENRLDFN